MNERGQAITTACLAGVVLAVVLIVSIGRPAALQRVTASEPIRYRIDPNRADAEQLCLLPGVGPGIAERIVADRAANGPFSSAEDMQRVPHIGEKTAAAIRPWVAFE